jgi:hypothetical protein
MSFVQFKKSCLQTCPLDFSTDHFYESRKAMVDDRLTEINGASSEVSKVVW